MIEAEERQYNFNPAEGWQVEENDHPIEEVRLTVDPIDNPNLPVLTLRAWVLGVTSCVMLSFANTFFGYRSNQLYIGSVCVQIITLPIGRFFAKTLPNKKVNMIPFANWASFSLNPGPFSMKEHCLITIIAGAGGGGGAIGIITIVKAFYHRKINPVAAFLLVQTTSDMYTKAAQFWAELRVELLSASTFLPEEKPTSGQVWRLYWASHQATY